MNNESNPQQLTGLGHKILAHWREHRPRMVKELEASGKLRQAVFAAQELTSDVLVSLIHKGVDPDRAWEMIREEWALLPAEPEALKSGAPESWIDQLSPEITD